MKSCGHEPTQGWVFRFGAIAYESCDREECAPEGDKWFVGARYRRARRRRRRYA